MRLLRRSYDLELLDLFEESGRTVQRATMLLRDVLNDYPERADLANDLVICENEGDRLSREAMASLFANGIDPMVVIRWKDIFASLEASIDACEHVAHLLEGIALKRRR